MPNLTKERKQPPELIFNSIWFQSLKVKDSFISESCIEIKIKLNLYFHTSLWCSKGFMKAFIKTFEAPQRSVKIKI